MNVLAKKFNKAGKLHFYWQPYTTSNTIAALFGITSAMMQQPLVAVAYKSASAPFTPKYSVYQPQVKTDALSESIKRIVSFIEQLKLGDVAFKKLGSIPDWSKLIR